MNKEMKRILLSILMICFVCCFSIGLFSCNGDEEIILPSSVTISSNSDTFTVTVSNTIQLQADVEPSDATNKSVTWISSDPEVATVSETGLVTGVKEGSSLISVSTKENNITSNVTIIVKKNEDLKSSFGEFTFEAADVNGYTFDSTTNIYTITSAGEYTVSGLLEGQIVFSSTLTEKCKLILDNAYIENLTGSAVYWCSEDSKLELEAKENTTNYLIEGEYESTTSSGAVNSENNLEICGDGIIYITSLFKHAIKASEITVKDNVELFLEAESDGLHGKTITIESGTINISNCSDGIEAEVNSKGKKGNVEITGGTINISDCKKAIVAEVSIEINGESVIIIMSDISNEAGPIVCPEEALAIENATIKINGENYLA